MSIAKLIVGNWKMNGRLEDSKARAAALVAASKQVKSAQYTMVVCPPATMLHPVSEVLQGSGIRMGAQDCHAEPSGAFTGDIAPEMLKELGCSYVILGHSERRQGHRETSEEVSEKAIGVHRSGMTAIICVGETDEQRTAGYAEKIVIDQIRLSLSLSVTSENTAIAYEPVWAIGTGKTATTEDIRKMHALIRAKVSDKVKNAAWMPILYGGSVKPGNAGDILRIPNVDGVLVGGASLKAEDFMGIARATMDV